MALGNPLPLLLSTVGGYEIERSVRFNNNTDDSRFEWTPSGAGNTKIFTFSCWIKRTLFGVNNQYLIRTDTTFTDRINFDASDRLVLMCRDNNLLYTTRVFRDPANWYHILVNTNTDNGTAGDRHQIWINGVRETAFDTNNNLNGLTIAMNAAGDHHIGGDGSDGFGGYMAEVHLIDGQQIDASNFGETDEDTGQWIPKKYEGTYGTNGFYLDFKDNSGVTSTTLGKDSSGNDNNFTPNNFSVAAGTGDDSVEDTPTNNYCTLNPISHRMLTSPTNGALDLVIPASATNHHGWGTFAVTSGKYYWECNYIADTGNYLIVGVGYEEANSDFKAVRGADGELVPNTGSVSVSFGDGDVIMVALDYDNSKWYIGKNGSWMLSGDPVNGTGYVHNDLTSTKPLSPMFKNATGSGSQTISVNFGARGFAHTPPTGFKALCTANLPTPTIKDGSDYFNSVLYTGNGSAGNAKTGVGFQPDLVWIKQRNTTRYHQIFDVVRGATKWIGANSTDEEDTISGVTSFDSDGFTLGTHDGCNQNTGTYVAWNWKESATAGFDIVSYTGNGSARTISHSLGVVPEMMIVKRRDGADNWMVYHKANGNTHYMELNSTATKTDNTIWNDTTPTSTVFSLGTDASVNANSGTYIAYLFASVKGFSNIGSYTGNGNADGTFIFTGLKTRYVLIKDTGATNSWAIYDKVRDPYNVADALLQAQDSSAEATYGGIDFLSNGFKIRSTVQALNSSGSVYIYAAFGDSPFKYANAH